MECEISFFHILIQGCKPIAGFFDGGKAWIYLAAIQFSTFLFFKGLEWDDPYLY